GVVVVTSLHVALGSSVLEVFAYGGSEVATRAGGLEQVLADGRGLRSDVGGPAGLAAKMARVLGAPVLRATMVERAAEYVQREHDPRQMAEQYLSIYQGHAGPPMVF